MSPLPLTGKPCRCRRGIERDNCPNCEGTGREIDWGAYWTAKRLAEQANRAARRQQSQDPEPKP